LDLVDPYYKDKTSIDHRIAIKYLYYCTMFSSHVFFQYRRTNRFYELYLTFTVIMYIQEP